MAYLEINEGPLEGTCVSLSGKLTIGRNMNNQLYLDDASVSRHHAEIWFKESYYTLVDVGSANGSLVNGEQLHRLVPRPLYNGDNIIIGTSCIVFHAQGEQPPGVENQLPNKNNGNLASSRSQSKLSVVMTQENMDKSVNLTLDASRIFKFDTRDKPPEKLITAIKRLQAMVDIAIDLGTILDPKKLANRIMTVIFDIFPSADRSFIMTFDKKYGELKPLAARHRVHDKHSSDVFQVSKTILNTIIEDQQSILLSDAQSDHRFADQKSIVDFSIRSLMCAPFIYKDELLGVIGVDTTSRQHAFSADDLTMLTGIASQSAVSIKNVDLYSAIEKETEIRTQLARYLPHDVVDGIINGTIPFQLGGEKKWGTVLFCDIVGFTTLADNLSALDVVEKLNRYYSLVTEVITRNHGTLHKFGGDMIMAFWNVMVNDDQACYNAVKCSLDMQNTVFIFDIQLEFEHQLPLHLGIGCNTGEFAGGNIGGANRMEYTVIGNNVNLAQRIESLASRWQVLVSEETYNSISTFCAAIKLSPAQVKGKLERINVYSIRSISLSADTQLTTIPLVIMTPEGSICGSGLAVKYVHTTEKDELHIISMATILSSWNTLLIQFDLPELSPSPRLSGTIQMIKKDYINSHSAYSYITLSYLKGDDEGFLLLRRGACLESKKDWKDMKRH